MTRAELFISKAQTIHNNLYDYSKVEYVNSQTKVIVICKIHGEFTVKPNNHTVNKSKCPKCNKFNGFGQEYFIKKAQELHPALSFQKSIYVNDRTKIVVECAKHGEYTTTPRCIMGGHGCRKCRTTALGFDLFVSRAREIFKDKYNYDKVIYVNNTTKIIVTCPLHGDFDTTPAYILDGHGCTKCAVQGKIFTTDQFVEKSQTIHDGSYDYSDTTYVRSIDKVEILCRRCDRKFKQLPGNHLSGCGCPFCGSSCIQCDFYDFVGDYNPEFNNRTVIAPYEIDCYIPHLKLGIEYNGLYWHSEGISSRSGQQFNKNIHRTKAIAAQKAGISLLQFWEQEWMTQRDLVKSMIAYRLGSSAQRFNARDLPLIVRDNDFAEEFYDNNHLQGYRSAKVNLSLGDLMMMSLSPISDGWEIIRIASRINTCVRGGVAKLLKYFIRKHSPHKITTFADLRYSNGNVYRKLGFVPQHISDPNYFYYKGDQILSRQKCQKNKLHKLLANFDASLSESNNMFNHGFRRVWDAGNFKFVMDLS